MPRLLQFSTNTFVEATIQRNLTPSVIEATDAQWLAFKEHYLEERDEAVLDSPSLPEHFHWEWSRKVRFYQNRSGYEFIGLGYDGKIQGILLLDYTRQARLSNPTGLPLVYIDYLATAPWNLRELGNQPEFKGVGRVLFDLAREESAMRGLGGRIGLHSLPQALGFYHHLNMVDLGPDNQYHGLHYFEIGEEKLPMTLRERSDDEIRELAELELQYDITICNPHLGLRRLSSKDILARVKVKKARAERAAQKVASQQKPA